MRECILSQSEEKKVLLQYILLYWEQRFTDLLG